MAYAKSLNWVKEWSFPVVPAPEPTVITACFNQSRFMPVNWQSPVNWQHPLNQGLISWWLVAPHWRGGTTFRDLCNRNHGTLTNMDPETDWVFGGRQGGWGALDFPGTDGSKVGIPASLPNLTGDFTILMWLKRAALDTIDALWSRWTNSTTARELYFYVTTGGNRLQVDIPFIAAIVTGATALSANVWYSVGCSRKGTTYNIWLNGQSDGEATNAAVPENGAAVEIGDSDPGIGASLAGMLDNIRVYDRALSAEEYQLEYQLDQQGSPGLLNRIQPLRFHVPAAAAGANRLIGGSLVGDGNLIGGRLVA